MLRPDQLDRPDRPNFPTKLDQLLDRACNLHDLFPTATRPRRTPTRPLTTLPRL